MQKTVDFYTKNPVLRTQFVKMRRKQNLFVLFFILCVLLLAYLSLVYLTILNMDIKKLFGYTMWCIAGFLGISLLILRERILKHKKDFIFHYFRHKLPEYSVEIASPSQDFDIRPLFPIATVSQVMFLSGIKVANFTVTMSILSSRIPPEKINGFFPVTNGLFFRTHISGLFPADFLMLPDTEQGLFNFYPRWKKWAQANKLNYEVVQHDNVEVSRLYVLLSTDPVQAQPVMNDRLAALVCEFNYTRKRTLFLAFQEEHFYGAISYNEMFVDAATMSGLGKEETYVTYKEDMEFIIHLIKSLKKNS